MLFKESIYQQNISKHLKLVKYCGIRLNIVNHDNNAAADQGHASQSSKQRNG